MNNIPTSGLLASREEINDFKKSCCTSNFHIKKPGFEIHQPGPSLKREKKPLPLARQGWGYMNKEETPDKDY